MIPDILVLNSAAGDAPDFSAAPQPARPWDIETYKLTAMELLLESRAELLRYAAVSQPPVGKGRIPPSKGGVFS